MTKLTGSNFIYKMMYRNIKGRDMRLSSINYPGYKEFVSKALQDIMQRYESPE